MPAVDGHGSAPVRVLLVEDHDLFRRGLKEMLREVEGLEVVGEAATGEDGIAFALRRRPDLVVMDVYLPDISGPEATRRLLAAVPGTRVVALTVSGELDDLVEAVSAGACGYVVKDSPADEIVAAARAAAAGDAVVSRAMLHKVLERLREDGSAATSRDEPVPDLSERELEILRLLTDGLGNEQIAAQLHVALTTVKHHVSSILEKLGVQNRLQAAVYAVRHGLA
jgi:NarL family two-component system response regulator LiaR